MAEILLDKVLNNEVNKNSFYYWLFNKNSEQDKTTDFSTRFQCSRTDFITYFLNFIHEDISSTSSDSPEETPKTPFCGKTSSEINKSLSFPLDLSAELNDSFKSATSTPKISKVNSESVLSYMSPVSPIYKANNSFSSPKTSKKITPQKICLGDFIVNRKSVSASKKKIKSFDDESETRRRIKPTNLAQQINVSDTFHKSENSFNFSKNAIVELSGERNLLLEERLKILPRSVCLSGSNKSVKVCEKLEIEPKLNLVSHRRQIDEIIKIYTALVDSDFILNLTSEIYFLISLIFKKHFDSFNVGIEFLRDRVHCAQLFLSVHNIIYFSCNCLENLFEIVRNFDKTTIKLLCDNQRLNEFVPNFIENLQKVKKSDRIFDIVPLQDNVCFNLDTDNRQNFPNDPTFHAFRKQRDLFYEILGLWEQQHLCPGFNFAVGLGGKIKSLLSLSIEPTNFVHFARLFKAQLLSTCGSAQDNNLLNSNVIESLGVDKEKFNRLRNRCVTKESCHGLSSQPKFSDREEFYRDFILVGFNHCFIKHLTDAIVEEIVELNDSNFTCEDGKLDEKEFDVDAATKKAYYSSIRSLRLLAKFQGFIDSIPYRTDINNYSGHVLTTHLKIRNQIHPNFDVKSILQSSIKRECVILCIPWLVKYLSMLDSVTLKLPYYTSVFHTLFWLYRNCHSASEPNIYLVKFSLGWLFELPNVPELNFIVYCNDSRNNRNNKLNGSLDVVGNLRLDRLEIVDQNILYLCCPFLDEIKKVLTTNITSQSATVKHITPVTAVQSPHELARKKLELQLQEAFFNGQPGSIRKTVEFVSERIASTCVKYICTSLVPDSKKSALERFRKCIILNEEEDLNTQKLKTKSNQLAVICLKELQDSCDREIENICDEKVPQAIDSLVSLDILLQTKEACVGITKKNCVDRIKQWLNTHVTAAIYAKDFHDEIQKISSIPAVKKPKKPLFMLPPGGTNQNHNETATSGVHVLEKIRDLCVNVLEQSQITETGVLEILKEALKSFSERGDINEFISATICRLLVDLCILLLANNFKVMSNSEILDYLCRIWRLYFNNSEDLFKSLLCPRNVIIFAQSNNINDSWNSFAKFCVYLIQNKMMTCENFENQCTAIFRTEWDKKKLKLITNFLKQFISLYKDGGGTADSFTFLLDFLSDYCYDL